MKERGERREQSNPKNESCGNTVYIEKVAFGYKVIGVYIVKPKV